MTDTREPPAPARRPVGRTALGLVVAFATGLVAVHWFGLDGQRPLREHFPDRALAACVAEVLGEESADATVSRGDLVSIATLTCPPSESRASESSPEPSGAGAPIRSLTGLERLDRLASLSLAGQQIVDLSPLAGLARSPTSG